MSYNTGSISNIEADILRLYRNIFLIQIQMNDFESEIGKIIFLNYVLYICLEMNS